MPAVTSVSSRPRHRLRARRIAGPRCLVWSGLLLHRCGLPAGHKHEHRCHECNALFTVDGHGPTLGGWTR